MKKIFSKRRESLTGAAFVYPGLIYLMLLIGDPIVYNFIISFQYMDVTTVKSGNAEWVGFENYSTLFRDDILLKVMGQTFTFTFWCILFQFGIGLLLAIFFNQKFAAAKAVRGLLLVVWVVPMTVTAFIFKFMFQTDGGLFNVLLSVIDVAPVSWLTSESWAMFSVIFTNCWVGIPFNMILLVAGLNGISQDIYESASIDGANGIMKFFKITLPMLKPAIISVLILGVIYTFKVFDLVQVMTFGGPVNSTHLLSTYSYRLAFAEYRFSEGAAVANILFICLLLVALLYLGLIKKEEEEI